VPRLSVMTEKTDRLLTTSWCHGPSGTAAAGAAGGGTARASYRQSAGRARVTATAPTRQATPPLTIAIRTEPVSEAASPDSRLPSGSRIVTLR
jgi:hypothetical protein